MKKNICKHSVMAMCRDEILSYPAESQATPLLGLNKKGRKSAVGRPPLPKKQKRFGTSQN